MGGSLLSQGNRVFLKDNAIVGYAGEAVLHKADILCFAD